MRLTISLPKTTYNKSSLENKVSHQVVLLYFFLPIRPSIVVHSNNRELIKSTDRNPKASNITVQVVPKSGNT